MNHINKFILSTIAFGILSSTTANAAQKVKLRDKNLQFSSMTSIVKSNPAKTMGLTSNGSLSVVKTYTNKNGDVTTRYRQNYKGVPVIGDNAIISFKANGSFKRAHGAVVYEIANDLTDMKPTLSVDEALAKGKLLSTTASPLLRAGRTSVIVENETSILSIWQDEDGTARLVYEVSFFQHGDTPSRPYYIIDANTGEVLVSSDNLQTAEATGPGGNEKTGEYQYGTDFGYLDVIQSGDTCTMESTNVKTINLNNGTRGTTAFSFTCPENTAQSINGAYSPLNDAHFFGGVVFDMYQEWVNAAPLSFQLEMRVHYSSNYENAFWDGSAMTFGDGADFFYPLVSLDVSAHEVSHGFTEQNSGLVYAGKPGGLNEAFSDMAGEAAENFMNGTNDWAVGAEIFKSDGALRYMNNPPLDRNSIDHQSDYYDGIDVHYSSGVYNKAFYNLATTDDWSVQKAFQIYALANQIYWTANVDWDEAGNGVMDAACDLGYNTDDVKASLSDVGITSDISEGSDCATDTTTEAETETEIDEFVLENNVTKTNLSAETGDDIIYTMDVPAGATDITFNITGGTGDADLYVRFGAEPTDRNYDCRPYVNGNVESCTGTETEGTYYVRVKAYSSFTGLSLVGSYTEVEAEVEGLNLTESNISVARRQWLRYTQDITENYATLTVSLSGGTGNADLYLRHEASSTTRNFDCRSNETGNNEVCTISSPDTGIWHIDLRGNSAASGVTLNVKTEF